MTSAAVWDGVHTSIRTRGIAGWWVADIVVAVEFVGDEDTVDGENVVVAVVDVVDDDKNNT